MNLELEQYLATHSKTHLVFDFDETVAKIDIDWSGWHRGAADIYAKYDSNHGFHPGKEHTYVNTFVERFGTQVGEELSTFNREYEAKFLRGFIPNPELIEFIRENHKYQLSLYTSNSKQTLQKALEELELSESFEKVVCREDVTFIKPNPEGFILIYAPSEPKANYLMIGDSHMDEGAAKSFGIDFFKVDFF